MWYCCLGGRTIPGNSIDWSLTASDDVVFHVPVFLDLDECCWSFDSPSSLSFHSWSFAKDMAGEEGGKTRKIWFFASAVEDDALVAHEDRNGAFVQQAAHNTGLLAR